ncbi:MAG: type II glyceraldehyde-3-phosphate dehydrogenase [Candidatus Heimdallarchaeota archaeon]|nr:type II glyceraldehyde-3-phosphate dehydrogenase [Candidatus Heimdallarchaeota archaeon]
MTDKVKVGVIGYGVIGKRVADAVHVQPDMELVGIADIISDARMDIAVKRGYPIYCWDPHFKDSFARAGIEIAGVDTDFVEELDIVVDCTPKGIPDKNRSKFNGIPTIVQGGEPHKSQDASFSTFANYGEAFGKNRVRVVSCNTTGLARILSSLDRAYGIETSFISIVRRAADPLRTNRGPINGVVPVLGISHHGPDVVTVMPQLQGKIYSLAIAASFTLSHVHMLQVKLNNIPSNGKKDIIDLWGATPRIITRQGRQGLFDTAQLVEYFRDLGRLRNDRPENFIWEETIDVTPDGSCYFIMDIHMESIPIPENVDCIRAMLEMEDDYLKSAYKTDLALEILNENADYGFKIN